jgi:ABC-type cobalamin/Fe3+-siderophores transport system ATPase subunit
MFKWSLNSITFSSGQTVELPPASIIIITGPNNSGKSTALRDIPSLLQEGLIDNNSTRVVKSAQSINSGNFEDFLTWISESFSSINLNGEEYFVTKNATLYRGAVMKIWEGFNRNVNRGEALNFLVRVLDTESRIAIGNGMQSIDLYSGAGREYIHFLQTDEELRKKISYEIRKAFGVDLIINWGGSSRVWFHVGDEPERNENIDRVSLEYQVALRKLPILESEGDGIRSFVGILLTLMCGSQPLLLIDEPEVFLHPPQIKRLSALLARNAKENSRQIIVSTHNSDLVRGIIENTSNVIICRITRDKDKNYVSVLDSENITQLWSKPLLRSAVAIDGILHEGVVICEADSDCRFYETLLNQISEQSIHVPELFFIHGGGKGAFPALVEMYVKIGMPVVVVCDFDILRNKKEFYNTISVLGHDTSFFDRDYNVIISALNAVPPKKPLQAFIEDMNKIIKNISSSNKINSTHRRNIIDLVNESVDWSQPKRYVSIATTSCAVFRLISNQASSHDIVCSFDGIPVVAHEPSPQS